MEYTYPPEKSSGDYARLNGSGDTLPPAGADVNLQDISLFFRHQDRSIRPDVALKTDDSTIRKKIEKQSEKSESDDGSKDQRRIRCRYCGHPVTRHSHRIDINGSHHHTFNNPSGYLFEIGCFSMAEGCTVQGKPTLEFSWFTGYNWCFALCAQCRAHLGWMYQSMSGSRFYGLILNHLAEK